MPIIAKYTTLYWGLAVLVLWRFKPRSEFGEQGSNTLVVILWLSLVVIVVVVVIVVIYILNFKMPPRINGLLVSTIVASNKSEITSNLTLQSALKRIQQLEEQQLQLEGTQKQLLMLNSAMVELVTDLVEQRSASTSFSPAPVPPPPPSLGIPWSPSSSTTSSLEAEEESSSTITSDTYSAARALRKRQRREIARLVSIIDIRASFYNRERPHLAEDCDILCSDFALAWSVCCGDSAEEQQVEQRQQYHRILDPYPKIQWGKLNKWALKNLPQPELFPVHSCPEDPEFYLKLDKKMADRARGMGKDNKAFGYGGPCQAGNHGWTSADC